MYFLELRERGALSQSLGNPAVELVALFGVREVFEIDNLELTNLFNESKDSERIVVESGTVDGVKHTRQLYHDYRS